MNEALQQAKIGGTRSSSNELVGDMPPVEPIKIGQPGTEGLIINMNSARGTNEGITPQKPAEEATGVISNRQLMYQTQSDQC